MPLQRKLSEIRMVKHYIHFQNIQALSSTKCEENTVIKSIIMEMCKEKTGIDHKECF